MVLELIKPMQQRRLIFHNILKNRMIKQYAHSIYNVFVLLFLGLISSFSNAQEESKPQKKVNFAAVPVVNYSNATGFSLGAMGQAFYKISKKDNISPVSSSGIYAMYTTNGTWFGAIFQRLYINEDRWRILAAVGSGNINYQYFQEIPIFGTGGFIGYNTQANFAMLKVERKIIGKLYFGLLGIYSNSKTVFDLPEFIPPSLLTNERSMNSFGYTLNYDKRDNQINPFSGYNITFRNNFYRDWIGSDDKFESYNFTYNHFVPIKSTRDIIATRFHAAIATGDVPFQGQNVVGQDDIRGYTEGRYRDNQVYAIQTEYRHRFQNKFGVVGFFGLATAVETLSDITNGPLLPGGGLGIRYMAIAKQRINIGLDAAIGKDDWGIYFRIGESFGR